MTKPVMQDGSDFLNHVKNTLEKCSQRGKQWKFADEELSGVDGFFVAEIEFERTGDVVEIKCPCGGSLFWCRNLRGDYAKRIENLLNGQVRDDAGNMVPPNAEPASC